MINVNELHNIDELMRVAKFLEGKTLAEISEEVQRSDRASRIRTKGIAGYLVENGYFGIKKNSDPNPDIKNLGVEIKTCPIKYIASKGIYAVKEPLSLNIINYGEEVRSNSIKESSLYRKNKRILFIFYLYDKSLQRSQWKVKYVFLWDMDQKVIAELEPDYQKIIEKIKRGEAHRIHQTEHMWLTLCPKHVTGRKYTKQLPGFPRAEIRAFRLKSRYVALIITRYLKVPLLEFGRVYGWRE